jgi:hypothetical protein
MDVPVGAWDFRLQWGNFGGVGSGTAVWWIDLRFGIWDLFLEGGYLAFKSRLLP